ncbi:MAG: peptide-methionine (S)-S-oxide reductase MsrA [Acidimicrobiia bacterium]
MFKRTKPMPSPESALPGRSEPVTISGSHYVNGSNMKGPFPEGSESVFFAMGCFWGAERIFWEVPGVITTAAGYQGGITPNPTYEETCTGATGHTEAVHVVYDPETVSIDILLKHFWEQHDPTTLNRQGNDVGTQYRSAIYWTSDGQREAIEASAASYGAGLADSGFGAITTEVRSAEDAGEFFYAEEYHQQYLAKNPNGYCNHGFCQIPYAAGSDEEASA